MQMNEVVCPVRAGSDLRGCWEVGTLTDTQVWSSRNEERIAGVDLVGWIV